MTNLLEAGKKGFHMLVGVVYRRQTGYWTVILAGVGRRGGRLHK